MAPVDVVVVGAGLAGLQAARTLKDEGLSVIVVDAGNHLGGRVSQLEGLAPWPLQLGPEFLHGEKHNLVKKLADARGWKTRVYQWPDRYYFGGTPEPGGAPGRLVRAEYADENDPDVAECHRLFDELPDVPTGRDISAASWLADVVGANARVRKLADAIYANDFGCSLHKMGMHESVIEKKAWKYGEQYLVLDRSLSHVAAALAEGVDVRLGWMAKRVERGDGGDGGDDAVVVRSRDGAHVINARKVVIAVPITALKGGRARGGTGGDGGGGGGGDDDDAESSNAIVFDPPLPPLKANAANAVSMSNAVKVFIGFDEMFWPADLFDVVCVDCYLPELWVLTYPPEERTAGGVRFEGGDGGDDDVARRTRAVVTFFVAGDLADEVTMTPKETVIERALDQLDTMFGTVADPKPSRRRMTGAHVHDWSAETTVLGAYTHPTLDAAGARQVLAAPVGDWLFFAGEATHVGVNPCMQGAMETGVRAAAQVMASARPGATSKM